MPQNFLNKKVLFTLMTTGVLSKITTLQMYAQNNFPITPEQYLILSILVESGEMYQRQICEIAYKDRPNMTRIINILEEQGFVRRIPDVNKRKVFKIIVTPEGAAMHAKIKPHMFKLRDETVKNIKTEDLEACLRVMGQMIDNLEEKAKLHI